MTFRPMRGSVADETKLTFPYMASPKIDGIRALVANGKVLSKSLKPIANEHVQRLFSGAEFHGLDGELIVPGHGEHTFRKTAEAVRRSHGEPNVQFHVFDCWSVQGNALDRYSEVMRRAHGAVDIYPVPFKWVRNLEELEAVESQYLADGFEGVMLRSPGSPYKHGLATVNENYLLKLKRFEDGEARVVGWVEYQNNQNAPYTNELGYTVRSSSKAGKRPAGILGKFLVEAINGHYKGKTFEVGTGYTMAERADFWARREEIKGEILTFRHQKFTGGYDLPRIPTFQGFRPPEDLVN